MTRVLANWVSYIFEPFLTTILAFLLVLISLNSNANQKLVWGLIALIVGGLPPLVIYVYEKKIGKIKDWLITNRLERRDVQAAWFFGSGLISLIFWYLQAPRLLIATCLSLFVLSAVTSLATYIWKISIHTVGVTFLILILLLVYSSAFLPAVLLIVLISWSRIYLGHHTLSQVSAGSIATILVVYYVFNLFGLATF